jgi:metallo-beta-lactamase family protein
MGFAAFYLLAIKPNAVGRSIRLFSLSCSYVVIDDQCYAVRAKIHIVGGYSARAYQDGLATFVSRIRRWASKVRIVQGDVYVKQADRLDAEWLRSGRA